MYSWPVGVEVKWQRPEDNFTRALVGSIGERDGDTSNMCDEMTEISCLDKEGMDIFFRDRPGELPNGYFFYILGSDKAATDSVSDVKVFLHGNDALAGLGR